VLESRLDSSSSLVTLSLTRWREERRLFVFKDNVIRTLPAFRIISEEELFGIESKSRAV
jgi:hypothetical protein